MSNDNKDTKYVMGLFAVICIILVCLMINNFRIIDCCYLVVVIVYATKYFLLSRD